MKKLALVHRVLSPELYPRYIVQDENGKLRLLKSDSELIDICDRLQNYDIAAGYGTAMSRNTTNTSGLIFKPTNGNAVIDSITSEIPASYWYARVQAGMKKSDIVTMYIRQFITDQV